MKKSLAGIIATFIALAGICSCGPKQLNIPQNLFASELDSIEVKYAPVLGTGDIAPEFNAADTLGTFTKLSDLAGNIVVLDFWASWCGDCRREIPVLKAMYEKYNGAQIAGYPVKFVSISFDRTEEAWKAMLQKEQFGWLQLADLGKWKELKVTADYQLSWIPTFYVIGPDGKIINGCIKASRIGEILEAVVAAN